MYHENKEVLKQAKSFFYNGKGDKEKDDDIQQDQEHFDQLSFVFTHINEFSMAFFYYLYKKCKYVR
ncbi:hypothetical protein J8TS2_35180 [Lederbergia ruris]|uniref:Uncharacterized protein n=1 Tax=Lederbergia ruris TaxID=217495 RepID=A0ABQ4KQ02_9BACI|nr:hypothetical protein J8TS2_35180 [Lederbergia ruris]